MLGEQSLFIILHKISKITKTFLGKFWEKYIAFSQLHYNYWKQNTFFCSDRKSAQNNCDGVLQAEGKKFPVHKCILEVVSPFFQKLFTTEVSQLLQQKWKGCCFYL